MKKRLTIAVVLTLLLTFFVSSVAMAAPPQFVIDKQIDKWQQRSNNLKDIQPGNPFYKEIQRMVDLGIINGYPDGYFKPEEQVTRDQFAKMLVLSMDLDTKKDYVRTFDDVSSSHPLAKYITAAKPYLTGYEKNDTLYFHPELQAVREDVTVAVVKSKGLKVLSNTETDRILKNYKDSDTISENLRPYVATAIKEKLVLGWQDKKDNWYFGAQNPLKRVEAALLLYRACDGFEKVVVDDENQGNKVVIDDEDQNTKGKVYVTSVTPAHKAVDVSVRTKELEVKFNRNIQALVDDEDLMDGITVENLTEDETVDIDRIRLVDNKLFIRLIDRLEYDCKYEVVIAKDLLGDKNENPLAKYSWTFTTED
jgi:hypothetical protein